MGQVSSDTGGVDNIVECELVDEGRELQEKRERLSCISCHSTDSLLELVTNLANATRGSSNDCDKTTCQ